jgi:uncharacterized phiE125 gp8 family phage protein
MSAFLVAGPAIEPVPIADIRDWLKIDASEEDATLATLVATARAALERHVRRAFVSQTWRFIYASTAADGAMRLPLAPLLSLVELRVYDGAGVITSAPPQAIELDLDLERPAVRLIDADLRGKAARIEIDATMGYGAAAADVPTPLRQAIRMLVAAWHARRGDAGPGDGALLPESVAALVAPYRRVRLT